VLFNSSVFLVFAAVFFLAWKLVPPRKQLRWAVLIVASSVFYGWWDWRFLFLLAGTGLVDFLAALGMARYRAQKKLLVMSMLSNVGRLCPNRSVRLGDSRRTSRSHEETHNSACFTASR